MAVGDAVSGGSIIAEVRETASIMHKVMLAPDISGEVVFAQPDGAYPIVQELVRIRTGDVKETGVCMMQKWPIRIPRPVGAYPAWIRPSCDGAADFGYAFRLQREERRRFREALARERP